jgi:TusA-related sulfurtransferase
MTTRPDSGGNAAPPPRADAVLEAFGLTCGQLEPAIKSHIKQLAPGQVLEVRTDEPAAREGIPAWSRLTRYELLATIEEDRERTRFYLRGR